MREGRTCSRCVIDDAIPSVVFNDQGVCNYCTDALERMPTEWFRGKKGLQRLNILVEQLKSTGKDQPYDAMIGLSGGIDSSYLAHVLRAEYDLRLLAVHVDGGWNTEAAVRNIELLVRALDIDLHTYVVDWEEMRDLQLSFLKSSVLNQDIPQDHAFFSTLYRTARAFNIHHFLSGVNFSSECVMLSNWGYPAMDGRHLRAIHKRFGQIPLNTFPVMGVFEYLWITRVRKQLTIHKPLNYLDYDKNHAKRFLMERYGYKDYGGKHSESRFTKFYQDIYLPERYEFDKRRLHLSSQIVAGQVTRGEALEELSQPLITSDQARHELKFIAKKLQIPTDELRALITQAPVSHESYPNSRGIYRTGAMVKRIRRRIGNAQ